MNNKMLNNNNKTFKCDICWKQEFKLSSAEFYAEGYNIDKKTNPSFLYLCKKHYERLFE